MSDKPDTLGYRLKVGMVIPSTNTTVQPETDSVRVDGVTFHVGRIPISDRKISTDSFLDHVAAMRAGIETAGEQVLTAGVQSLIMGVALECFWGGVAGSRQLHDRLAERLGVPIILGSDAIKTGLDAFGARRIAVLTPHMPKGDDEVRNWLEQSGFSVVALKGLKCESPRAIAQVPEAEIRAALQEIDSPDVDALVQVGTNLAGARVCAEAERWLGKPALSINTVSAWHAMRQAGIADTVRGRGRILEEH